MYNGIEDVTANIGISSFQTTTLTSSIERMVTRTDGLGTSDSARPDIGKCAYLPKTCIQRSLIYSGCLKLKWRTSTFKSPK